MPQLFWFRTRQSLLEEWGYATGVWHLIRRTTLSMSILSLTGEGTPRRTSAGEYIALPNVAVSSMVCPP